MSILRIALCIVFSGMVGCGDGEERLTRLPDNAIVLAFGDSLTVGVGVHESQSYPAVLAQLSGREVVTSAISGEVSAKGLKRLPEVLERTQPNLLILLHGGNDILRNRPTAQLKSNLDQMITLAQSQRIPVVLLGVPEKKLFSDTAPLYRELAEQHSLVFIDDLLADLIRTPSMKSDGVHLNADGYRALAEGIHAVLEEEGAL